MECDYLEYYDQFIVKEGERKEWSSVHDGKVEKIGVEDPIETVLPECTQFKHFLGRIKVHTDLFTLVFEEARNVIDDGEEANKHHVAEIHSFIHTLYIYI